MNKILVTTALPYANGPLHLGHMIEQIQADIWVRCQRLWGKDCLFICGDDAHGTPIMLSAKQQNITPEDLIAVTKKQHEEDSAAFSISFDNYYTTHSEENRELVAEVYRQLQAHDDIEVRTVVQAYDPIADVFLPDRFVRGTCPKCNAVNQHGDSCEICGATYTPSDLKDATSVISGSTPIQKASEHYFFRLEKYTAMLKTWIEGGTVQPEVVHKLQEWFKQGLKQWDISRDTPYFGFPIPNAPDKYFYVWLDAPIGYMASLKNLCARRPDLSFDDYWRQERSTELYHFIGKDIVYFHALFWPAILESSNFRKPTSIFVHGYLTVDGQKMSKSRGTFILARDYLQSGLNPEYLRYYFAAKLNSSIDDIDFNLNDFVQRVNSDLVGKVVNIASRCAGFVSKHFNHQLSATLDNSALFEDFQNSSAFIADAYAKLEYNNAMRLIMGLADKANQYIDEKKPWQLTKQDPVSDEVQNICTMGINLFRLLVLYLKPVLPHLAEEAESFLNIAPLVWQDRQQPLLSHTVNDFHPLIQRVDVDKVKTLVVTRESASTKTSS